MISVPEWLAENFEQFDDALQATRLARQEKTFSDSDMKHGKAVYELRRPLPECRLILEGTPHLELDTLSKSEREEGFSEAKVWFEESTSGKDLGFGNEVSAGF